MRYLSTIAYDVLRIPRDASAEEIRRAYHRLALEQHPDRSSGAAPSGTPGDAAAPHADFVQLQQAWEALREPEARRRYDAALQAEDDAGMRATARTSDVDLGDMEYTEDVAGLGVWSRRCRCGATFELTEDQLADGIETLECSCCSLAIRLLYQRAEAV